MLALLRSRFRRFSLVLKIGWFLLALAAYCEFGIYYVVLFQCSWPKQVLDSTPSDTLNAMFLADTHLLGPIKGHWFDKLRREWQMHRAFQSAVTLYGPEAIFFLGDVFDEGMWVNSEDFEKYVSRFHSLFKVPEGTRRHIIAGNHDVGFHYIITPELVRRFHKALNSPSVRTIRLKGTTFILINSMAMERDGCFLCKPAIEKLQNISAKLRCDRNPGPTNCDKLNHLPNEYIAPVLLQHFPLYRKSDETCTGPDAASESEKKVQFRQTIDCLSETSTKFLLAATNPRLVISGHTHNGCEYVHKITDSSRASIANITEYSVPSFSWRNRDNPSFYLGTFTKTDYSLKKCSMPRESTVIRIYTWGIALLIVYIILCCVYRFLPSRRSALAKLRRWVNSF